MSVIENSAPARVEAPSTFVPLTAEKKAALRAYAVGVVAERLAAGLYPDGRIRDMAIYAEHLRKRRAEGAASSAATEQPRLQEGAVAMRFPGALLIEAAHALGSADGGNYKPHRTPEQVADILDLPYGKASSFYAWVTTAYERGYRGEELGKLPSTGNYRPQQWP